MTRLPTKATCFRCGSREGVEDREVGTPAYIAAFCPPCVEATGAKPTGSAIAESNHLRALALGDAQVWPWGGSRPPKREPFRGDFRALAESLVGPERAAAALAPEPFGEGWEDAPGEPPPAVHLTGCPGCGEATEGDRICGRCRAALRDAS